MEVYNQCQWPVIVINKRIKLFIYPRKFLAYTGLKRVYLLRYMNIHFVDIISAVAHLRGRLAKVQGYRFSAIPPMPQD